MVGRQTTRTRRSRSDVTKDHLLRAAEKLFARDGLANVTVRAVITEAGQKNESALQYHFGNRDGLIAALHDQRNAEIRAQRRQMLDAMLARHQTLTLRDIAVLMVRPAFELAAGDSGFRDYMKSFAHLALFSSQRITTLLLRQDDTAASEMRERLRTALPHLDEVLFNLRFENAVRFATLSMSRHARAANAFRGHEAEFFFNNLVDTIVAMMAAQPSAQTLALLNDSEPERSP